MKRASIAMCLILVLSACRPKYAPFVQGDIRIVPPIKQAEDEHVEARFINDGGTTWLTIVDATGKSFDVYFDRRLRAVNGQFVGNEPGSVYLNAYPESSNAVRIIDQNDFQMKVLKWIKKSGG